MSTDPQPPSTFVEAHDALDERLAEAFRRYDQAFRSRKLEPTPELVTARMDLSLLLWQDEEAPEEVRDQLAADAKDLLRDTPPL